MGHKVKKVDTAPLEELITVYELSVADIASRTDQSVSAIYQWRRDGLMPGVMVSACKGVRADLPGNQPQYSSNEQTLLVRLPSDKRERFDGFLEGIGARWKVWTDPTNF